MQCVYRSLYRLIQCVTADSPMCSAFVGCDKKVAMPITWSPRLYTCTLGIRVSHKVNSKVQVYTCTLVITWSRRLYYRVLFYTCVLLITLSQRLYSICWLYTSILVNIWSPRPKAVLYGLTLHFQSSDYLNPQSPIPQTKYIKNIYIYILLCITRRSSQSAPEYCLLLKKPFKRK